MFDTSMNIRVSNDVLVIRGLIWITEPTSGETEDVANNVNYDLKVMYQELIMDFWIS